MKHEIRDLMKKYDLDGEVEYSFSVNPQSMRDSSPTISGISELFDLGTEIRVGDKYYSAQYVDFQHCSIIEILDREKDYVVERVYL